LKRQMRQTKLSALLLVLVTLALFSPTATHEFIAYDDPGYVTNNAVVQQGLTARGVEWALGSTSMSNWHPVTWLSHMLDVQLFGLAPAGHHLMSVALHATSALLLFLFLVWTTACPWRSLVVAGLFALHPLHVESVAWVAERKDVLSGLLWHLTLLLYAAYVLKRGVGRYLATLACYAVALMTKPMVVTLPVVMLLVDWWPLERTRAGGDDARPHRTPETWGPLLWEKVPFLLLSVASSAITIVAQDRGGSMVDLDSAPVALRLANAAMSYVRYIVGVFWPRDMAVLYPLPPSIPAWQFVGSLSIHLLAGTGVLWAARRKPYLATGWFWFLITALPVIGVIQVGAQSMADRYTYLPLTGLFIIVVWGGADLLAAMKWSPRAMAGLGTACLVAAAALSWNQLGYWRDSLTLFKHTLDVTTANYLIMNNFGAALNDSGRPDEAIQFLERAIAIRPSHAEAFYNLGRVHHLSRQDYPLAAAHYARAIELKPKYTDAHINLGGVYNSLGRFSEALAVLEAAKSMTEASRPELLFNAGVSYASLGRTGEALREVEALRAIDPSLAQRLQEFVTWRTSRTPP